MFRAVLSLFPGLLGTSSSAHTEFYDKLQREANGCDCGCTKKHDECLNATLIFVGVSFFIFASATVFIWFF